MTLLSTQPSTREQGIGDSNLACQQQQFQNIFRPFSARLHVSRWSTISFQVFPPRREVTCDLVLRFDLRCAYHWYILDVM